MRKVLFILIAGLFLVGCSEESNHEIDTTTTEENTEVFADREPLPFGVAEFEELYADKFKEFIGTEEGTALSVREETVALVNGTENEALILLYSLNDLTDGNSIGEYAEKFHSDLTNDTFYADETVIEGLEINISAHDINSVSISVFNGE